MLPYIRSTFQRTNSKPLLITRLSTQSPSSAASRITQAFTELQTTSSNLSDAKSPVDPTRAQQIVWLAQRSLASTDAKGSITQGSQHVAKAGSQQGAGHEVAKLRAQSATKSWDGPTIWAHLW